MKIGGKNIDTLHQVLFAIIVIVLMIGLWSKTSVKPLPNPENEFRDLLAQADYDLLRNNFDDAELAYIEISKSYPRFDSFSSRMEMVKTKREQFDAFNSFQEELDDHIEAIKNLESYMVVIENRNKNLMQSKPKTKMVIMDSTGNEITANKKIATEFNARTKDILDIVNYDGAEIKYIGETQDGKANGYGYAVFSKKGFYEGYWSDNMRNGKGIYYWQNGDTFEGSFLNGKRNGFGIYKFASGEVYEGNWKNNLRHGEGKLTNKKGKIVFEGVWDEDEPVHRVRKKESKL